jgi:hypothetical protein
MFTYTTRTKCEPVAKYVHKEEASNNFLRYGYPLKLIFTILQINQIRHHKDKQLTEKKNLEPATIYFNIGIAKTRARIVQLKHKNKHTEGKNQLQI